MEKISILKCKRCNHEWPTRNNPKVCPLCKSVYWNEERKPKRIDLTKLSLIKRVMMNDKVSESVVENVFSCSSAVLKKHISLSMKEGMTLDNMKKWTIFMIVPFQIFSEHENEIKRAYHYTNLKALWVGYDQWKNKYD